MKSILDLKMEVRRLIGI